MKHIVRYLLDLLAGRRARRRIRRDALIGVHFDIVPSGIAQTAAGRILARRAHLFAIALVLLLLYVVFIGYRHITKAEVALYYPAVCLGGWENPAHASGEPDAEGGFTVTNSAVLEDAHSQIFCSGFEGQLPEGVQQQKVLVRFSWGERGDEPTATTTIIADDGLSDSTVEDIINLPPESPGSVTVPGTDNGEEPAPEPEPETPDAPATDAPADEEPVPDELPEEPAPDAESPDPQEPAEEEPSVEPEPEPQEPEPEAASEPVSLWGRLVPHAWAQEEPIPDPIDVIEVPENDAEDAPVQIERETVPGKEPMLEVLYTLDGTEWRSLGTVASPADISAFEIPIAEVPTPEDLANVQVAVHALPTVGSRNDLYLDSIWLEVEYADPAEDPYPPPDPLHGDVFLDEKRYEGKVAVLVARPSDTGTTTELWLRDDVEINPSPATLSLPTEEPAPEVPPSSEVELIESDAPLLADATEAPEIPVAEVAGDTIETDTPPEEPALEAELVEGQVVAEGTAAPASTTEAIPAPRASPNWVRIAGDELLGDDPQIDFDHGSVFWIGEGNMTAWRYQVATGSYESVSVSGGSVPTLYFTDEGSEARALIFRDRQGQIRIDEDPL